MKKILPIILLLMAVVLGATGAGLFTSAAHRPASMAAPTPSPTRTIVELPPPPMVLVTPTAEPSSEVQETSPEKPPIETQPVPSPDIPLAIDLSDPDTYRRINVFLSNFSEGCVKSFATDAPSYPELVSWAYYHAEVNSPALVEDCYEMRDDCPVNRRLSEKNILKILRRFFGERIDSDAVAKVCEDGYYYGTMTDGEFSGYAFSLADSITDLGGNRFEVKFHVYGVPGAECESYDDSSSSAVYSAHPDDLPAPLYHTAQKFSNAPGTATIELTPNQTSAVPYHLLAWECDYQWDGVYYDN